MRLLCCEIGLSRLIIYKPYYKLNKPSLFIVKPISTPLNKKHTQQQLTKLKRITHIYSIFHLNGFFEKIC